MKARLALTALVIVGTAAIATTLPGRADGSPVLLRYKFTPGKTIRYQMNMDMNGAVPMGQQTMPIKQAMVMKIHQTVKKVRPTDGAATLVYQVDSMNATMNGQAMPMPESTASSMKKPMSMVMLPSGKMLSAKTPMGMGGGMPGMDMSNMSSMMSAGTLPTHPVNVGDSWTQTMNVAASGLHMNATYRLKSVHSEAGRTIADIGVTNDGTMNMSRGPATGMKGTISGSGVMRFDVDKGEVNGGDTDMDMDLNLPSPPQAGAGAKPMRMKMMMHMTMTKL